MAAIDIPKSALASMAAIDFSKSALASMADIDFSRGLGERASRNESNRRTSSEVTKAFNELVADLDFTKAPIEALAEVEAAAGEIPETADTLTEADRIAIATFAGVFAFSWLTYLYVVYPAAAELVIAEGTFAQLATWLFVLVHKRLGR